MNIKNKVSLLALALIGLTLGSCQRDGGPKRQSTSKTKIDHLLIKEVYYIGHYNTRDTRGKYGSWGSLSEPNLYDDDQYIIIYNPTDEVKYLDGLALASNALDPSQLRTFSGKENYVMKYYGASGISYFPGSGKEHPVQPKGTVVIAKYAVDHHAKFIETNAKQAEEYGEEFDPKEYINIESFLDLSKADFEISNVKFLPNSSKPMNNPNVPDLEPILQYKDEKGDLDADLGFSGVSSSVNIALIKLPWTPEDFAKNYKDTKDHKGYYHYISINSSNFADYYAIEVPNDNVIDCVTICPKAQYQMKTTKLDKGHNAVTDRPLSSLNRIEKKQISGLAITRKWDGRKFIDGDNSTQDFEAKTASLSRRDAKGNVLK